MRVQDNSEYFMNAVQVTAVAVRLAAAAASSSWPKHSFWSPTSNCTMMMMYVITVFTN